MMGKDHAWSGLAVGIAVASQLGYHSLTGALPFAIVVAGFALAPDLDCSESTASRFLGWFSELLSWFLEGISAFAFRLTATNHDHQSSGTHRHLTHTAAFALIAGLTAHATSLLSPWAVLGWLVFGVLAAAAALSEWVLLLFGAGAVAPIVVDHASPMAMLAGMQHWIGLAVGLGCLVHCLGDAITVSGVPLVWPLPVYGQTWHEVHLLPYGFRLHTGLRAESWVVHPLLVGAAVFASALVWPRLGIGLHEIVTGVVPR